MARVRIGRLAVSSKVLAVAFSLSAEIERSMISSRTKEALARKKSKGKRLGLLVSLLGRSLLALVSGYGYKPGRAFLTYGFVLVSFWLLYLFVGQQPGDHLSPLGASVLSVSSFHGRGFVPGLNTQSTSVALSDPRIVIAAAEAFVGLFIEVTFIATFTQRFFGR